MKKISIITVCLNSSGTIKDTLESVKQQSYKNIEHIIVDGVSNDGTLDIVNQYSDFIAKIVSEKDSGIYDAMNKGIDLSTGDVLFFLNSDDRFYDAEVVTDVMYIFNSISSLDLLFGNVIYKNGLLLDKRSFSHITRNNIIYEDLCHQGVFSNRCLFQTVNSFNLDYKINADYDWLLKVFLSDAKIAYFPRDISYFNSEGKHSIDQLFSQKERMSVKLKYKTNLEYNLGKILYKIFRKLRNTKIGQLIIEKGKKSGLTFI